MKGVVCIAHRVKCVYCSQMFDRDKEMYIQVGRRYAHQNCALSEEDKKTQEEKDKQDLDDYIIKLLKIDYIDARIRKQIKQYVEEYKYTYSGIKKALVYFYEVKGNSIEKANKGIGIVPYIYRTAYEYYFSLWQAQQRNQVQDVSIYIPVIKEIHIPRPQRKIKKRKVQTFKITKERIMKNIHKLIAVVLIVCTLLCGCGTTTAPENTTAAPTTLPVETTAPTEAPTEAPTTAPTETTAPTVETTVPAPEETTAPTTAPTEPAHTHSFSEATCTQPKTCTTCGATEGEPVEHKYADGSRCVICDTPDPNYAGNEMVWIPTKGGKKYHTYSGCSNMDDPDCVTKEEAEYLGFEPCKKCH